MRQPIRWDNLNNSNLAQAANPLEAAQRSFQGAFSSLGDTLGQAESIDTANYQNTKANNTTAFLDAVSKYKTAADLKAAQQSGAIDALRQQYGYQIDANAARGAVDQRLATLMDQGAKEITYNHLLRDERTAPLLDAIHKAALDKNQKAFDENMAAYTAAGGVDAAGALKYKLDRERELVLQNQENQNFDLNQRKGNQDIVASNADIAYKKGMLGVSQSQAQTAREALGIQRDQVNFNKEDRLASQLQNSLEAMGRTANVSPGSPEGQAKIADYIDKIKDPDIQSNARAVAAKLAEDPNMTVAGVLTGISSVDKRDWFVSLNHPILRSNSNNIEEAVARGKAFNSSPDALQYTKRQEVGYASAQRNYEETKARLDAVRASLGYGPAKPAQPDVVTNPFGMQLPPVIGTPQGQRDAVKRILGR